MGKNKIIIDKQKIIDTIEEFLIWWKKIDDSEYPKNSSGTPKERAEILCEKVLAHICGVAPCVEGLEENYVRAPLLNRSFPVPVILDLWVMNIMKLGKFGFESEHHINCVERLWVALSPCLLDEHRKP